ncbi:oligosaccharide flippase family protein [uncultured Brachybacterium sp.]|uniref:oligosaccharide flippase family protein n=1 Tax=uncultured Brachybacterium sp. TaxID=189680 RepID=UPI00260206AC|nr:oligosaccharide flippase family protein [uncultured Brachybacterium sp.]
MTEPKSDRPWARIPQSHLLRGMLMLLSGSALAQIITLASLVLTARLYSDVAFGTLAIFTSAVMLIAPLAALRYDFVVMLPKTESEARSVFSLSRRIITSVSIVCLLASVAFQPFLEELFRSETIARSLLLVGPTVFLSAEITLMQTWMNRAGDYRLMSQNRIWLASGIGVGQIGMGIPVRPVPGGLIFGHVGGNLLAWVRIVLVTRKSIRLVGHSPERLRDLAHKYRMMPILNGANAMLDGVRMNGINFIIATEAVSALGQYNMAWRLTIAPLGLVSSSVSQVLFRDIARTEPGELVGRLARIVATLAAFGIPIFGLAYIFVPTLLPILLGAEWTEAGYFARALCPWLLLTLIASPIATIFIVTAKQHWLLMHAAAYCVAPLAFLGFASGPLYDKITILSLIMAGMLAIMVGLAFLAARAYDGGSYAPQLQ